MKFFSGILAFAGRITLAFGITGVHAATGGPIGLADLHALAGQSDAVVVGIVLQGLQTGRDVSFLLSVDRVLKGNVNPSETLTVQWMAPTAFNGSYDLKGRKGLFFLQKSATGAWQLLPAMAGTTALELAMLPATRAHVAPDLQYAAAAPIDEKLMLELAAAIENKDGSAFGVDYLAGLHTQGTAAVLKVYQRFSQSSSTGLRAYGSPASFVKATSRCYQHSRRTSLPKAPARPVT
jgi:hypothetical protein